MLQICSYPQFQMDVLQKLELLGDDTRFEVDSAAQSACAGFVPAGSIAKKTDALERSISTVIRSDGTRMPVLKTLLSSYCARNCFYCPWRRGRDLRPHAPVAQRAVRPDRERRVPGGGGQRSGSSMPGGSPRALSPRSSRGRRPVARHRGKGEE